MYRGVTCSSRSWPGSGWTAKTGDIHEKTGGQGSGLGESVFSRCQARPVSFARTGRSDAGGPGGCRPSSVSVQRLERAVARIWFVNPPWRSRRNELDHDIHQVLALLVPEGVHPPGWFEEARAGRNLVRRAGGVVTLVEGRGAGLDDHEARPPVAVPAAGSARRDRHLEHVEVRHALGLDL